MAFGFPAQHRESIDLEIDRVLAREAICEAFEELEWPYQLLDVNNYRAWVPMSGESWGETIEVSLLSEGVMDTISAGRLITQWLDLGKNRRNVKLFLATFRMKCIAAVRNALPIPTGPDETGRTPVEKIFDEA